MNQDNSQKPTVPKFKAGDLVTFVNDYGIKFPERIITEVDMKHEPGVPRYYFTPHDAWWYPAREGNFICDKDDHIAAIVGGHRIRYMEVEKETDPWLLVGTTQSLFATMDAVREFVESTDEVPYDVYAFLDLAQGHRYNEPVESRLVMALPIKPYRPEAMRVTERKSKNDTWFEVETLAQGEKWIVQNSYAREDDALKDANDWYYAAQTQQPANM